MSESWMWTVWPERSRRACSEVQGLLLRPRCSAERGPETIKKAYRTLARQRHPDVSKAAGAESKFKEIGEAYATLKDPEKRAA
jgi:hypothetical protein